MFSPFYVSYLICKYLFSVTFNILYFILIINIAQASIHIEK